MDALGHAWATTIAVALTACTNPRTEQCNALVERANLSQTVLKGLTFTGGREGLESDAKKIDNEVAWVQHTELSDPTLVKFRDDFAGNLAKTAAAVRELAKLDGDVQSEAAKKIVDEADVIEKAQSKLVDDVNAYCGGR